MEQAGDSPAQTTQSSVQAQLSVRGGRAAVEFYQNAFAAKEIEDPFGHQWEIGKPPATWPPAGGHPVGPDG